MPSLVLIFIYLCAEISRNGNFACAEVTLGTLFFLLSIKYYNVCTRL